MTDPGTIAAYDKQAASFADDWEAQASPDDLYALIAPYFSLAPPSTPDADQGAGTDG